MTDNPTRVLGFDIARAVAVFGMVVVNFKVVMGAESAGPSWLVWTIGLLDGRAAATFVLLAGAGLSLLSRRSRNSADASGIARDRRTVLRRAVFLFFVGLAYTPIWPADILHFYGVYIAVAALFLTAPTRVLLTAASLLALLFMVLLLVLNYETGWDWEGLNYIGFWTPAGMMRHLFFNGFHPVVPWLAFMLVGMALGRLDLSNADTRNRVLRWSVSAAVLGESVSWGLRRWLMTSALSVQEKADLIAVVGTDPMPPVILYMVAAGGTAVTIVVACISLGQRFHSAVWMRPIVATGQMALTLYVAHVVIGMGVLEAAGALENQSLNFALVSAGIFCAASLVFASRWSLRFRRGPLESLMRFATDPRDRRRPK
ncbi:MAG: putative membrane protein YeiB [Bradymonadia bacterium]